MGRVPLVVKVQARKPQGPLKQLMLADAGGVSVSLGIEQGHAKMARSMSCKSSGVSIESKGSGDRHFPVS